MLRDLIATPGEAAAASIVRKFRFSGEAERELYESIRLAVDQAYETGRVIGMDCGKSIALARLGCRWVEI